MILLGKHMGIWEDNIKVDVKETSWKLVDLFILFGLRASGRKYRQLNQL
jgi:hypothetical protein